MSTQVSQNTRNFAQPSNIFAGANNLEITPFYLQSINIPGISFSHPEIGGRWSTKIIMNADNITFGDLSFTVIVDEDFLVYDELMSVASSQLDRSTGEFTSKTFEFWIAVTNGKGEDVIKWTFENAKIESIGDLQYDYSSDETSFTLDVTLKFDNFSYKSLKSSNSIPALRV